MAAASVTNSRPALLRLLGLILVGVVTVGGAIDGLIVGTGIVRPAFPIPGYIGMMLLLSGTAVGATVLAVLAGNLVNWHTRGRFVPILVTTEVVAVVLAVVQTWLLRNLVSQHLAGAILLGSLLLVALAGTVGAGRFRSIRAHSNSAIRALTAVAVVLLTALAAGVALLVYALSTIQIG